MKHKQKEPRRIRQAETLHEHDNEPPATNVSDNFHVIEEPDPKRIKFCFETTTENDPDYDDSSAEWKWNIADFRKDHGEHTKEQYDGSNEMSKKSKEDCNQLEHLSSDSNEASNNSKESSDSSKESSNSSKEPSSSSKGSLNNPNESSNDSIEETSDTSRDSFDKRWEDSLQHLRKLLYSSKEDEKNPKEVEEGLNESHSKNSSQVAGNQTEATAGWKLPVRSLKEPSNRLKTNPPSSELRLDTNTPVRKEGLTNFRNELPNDNMPVILNVFSLAKNSAPVQRFVADKRQENTVLFTPPCSPPYIQLGPFSGVPVSLQNQHQQPAFLQRNEIVASERVRENWYKPVQRVFNNQEYLPYPAQQVTNNPHEFHYNPVQQVYYNPPEYFSKPVQPVTSQENINKAAQQVNYNQNDLSKPVQQVYSQEFAYNPVQYVNYQPQEIANGVLPLEKQSSNQAINESPVQQNTAQYCNQGYYDYANNNEQNTRLKAATLCRSDNYLVRKSNYMPKGNGLYVRFKLQQEMVENKKPRRAAYYDVLPHFFEPPGVQSGSNDDVMYSNTPLTFSNNSGTTQKDSSVMFSGVTSTVYDQNVVNSQASYTNGLSVSKYRTENGCSVVLDGYGRNRVVQGDAVNSVKNVPVSIARNSPVFDNSFDTPTIISGKYYENFSEKYSENSSDSSAGVSGSYTASGNTSDSYQEFLSPRDAKVIELKQRLEEQEATLKKLRANR